MSEPKKRKLCEGEQEETTQSKLEDEEIKLLYEVETKIQEFLPIIEVVSSIVHPQSQDNSTKNLNDHELTFYNHIKDKNIFLSAAKHKKVVIVDFLIKCGVNVNVIDRNSNSAADYTWANKDYKTLLLLLKADSFFPTAFNLDGLNRDDDNANKIKNLVRTRICLHETIKSGGVDDVKNFKLNETSKLYLNVNNESAAYVALKHEKFSTYAYLKSIGMEFGKDEEKLAFDKLEFKENVALQEAMVHYFPPVPDAHIYYLISKSRSQKRVVNLSGKLKNYYRKLDEIPEISIIFKVIQYADHLDVVFDFDEAEVSKVYPLVSSKCCSRGETLYKVGRIFIAAGLKRAREEILGTIAHELTHMAIQILYGNDCNPYGKSDENIINFFKDFKSKISSVTGDPSKILLDAIDKYKESDHDSELIVRVPHILAQFSNGRNWLEEQIPQFFNFYKETIIPKCKTFLDESAILKPKSMIKSINESEGELLRLKKCNLFFKNIQNLVHDGDKKIFVYKVENTLLGTLKVLQRLYGKGYVNFHSHFLVLKFKTFISQLNEMGQAFFMEGSQWLIIEISHKPSEDEMHTACEKISELLEFKPNKSVIFVAHRNVVKFLTKILEATDLEKSSNQITDDDLNFDHLDQSSQNLILKNRVTFQGKRIMLKRLITSPELYKFINPGIIESLVEGREVVVGNEIFGLSSLEGPYADIIQQIDFESFVRRVKNSNDIFIVRSKQNEEAVAYLISKFKDKWITTKYFKNVKYTFEKEVDNEKIFLVSDRFKLEDFRNFCRMNSGKKTYLIDVSDFKTDSFILKQLYNPNYYVKRKFKKIFVKREKMGQLIRKNPFVAFIISCKNMNNARNRTLMNYTNVRWLSEGEARNNFYMLKASAGWVHWFQIEDDLFVWKNSHGSLANIRLYVHREKLESEKSKNLKLFDDESHFTSEDRKVAVIADTPGMGKSTTLTKLYETKTIADKHWIIRINLKDHLKAVRENIKSKESNVKNVIRFLQQIDPHLKDELNENLLKVALTSDKFPKCLLVAFDGFDEVLDQDDRENIIDLIQFLKDETHCKIWVTSRLQYKNQLEDKLNTFVFEFDPFDVENKKIFIEKYLKDRLDLILKEESFAEIFSDKENSKISVFTKQLLLKMKEIFKKDVREFIGTPLQLNLIMSGSVRYFKDWSQKEEELQLQYLGSDLIEVYENFIQRKYTTYFRKCNIEEKTRQRKEVKDSEKYNKDLSESLIYNHKELKPDEDYKKIILLIGLIQSRNNENFEFIHFTFREYYFTKMFSEYLFSEEIPPLFYEKMFFLYEKIFVKREYQMIRNFFNVRLKEKLPETKLEQFKTLFKDDRIMKPYITSDSPLKILAEEGHENIFNFIYSIYFHIKSGTPFLKMTNVLNRTIFLSSAFGGKYEFWKKFSNILEKGSDSSEKWERKYYHSLTGESICTAMKKGNWKLIKALLEGIEETFSENKTRSFLLAVNKKYHIFTEILTNSDSSETLDVLLRIGGKILSTEEQYKYFVTAKTHPSCLHASADKNSKFVNSLLEKWGEIMKPEEKFKLLMKSDAKFQRTILHTAAEKGNLEICKLILVQFDQVKQGVFLMLKDINGSTALNSAVRENQIEVVKFLIEKGKEAFKETGSLLEFLTVKEIYSVDLNNYKRNFESIKVLFRERGTILPADQILSPINDNCSTILFHITCLNGDLTAVNSILEKFKSLNLTKLSTFFYREKCGE